MKISGHNLLFLITMTFVSCARVEVNQREEAMRASYGPESFLLEQSLLSWKERDKQLELNISWLEKTPEKELVFGACHLSSQEYANSLRALLKLSREDFKKTLLQSFKFFEVYGKDHWGEVLLTSYYSPVVKGSRRRTEEFSRALYAVPKDLVMISYNDFVNDEIIAEGSYSRGELPALIEYDEKGKVSKIAPYFSRREIDSDGVLKGRGLELAYVDPVDAFFLQIQGSGVIEFSDGTKLALGYAAQNGHRYYSIGKSLFDIIPQDEMSKDKLVSYLGSLEVEQRDELLFENPSYVFFRKLEHRKGQTTFGPTVIDKRTIAVDYRVFPLGALAFLDFNSPEILTKEELQSFSSEQLKREGRFVFAHDSGGAIKGPGRADLYWGEGKLASYNAGVMRHRGKMWFVAPKNCEQVRERE